MNYLLSGDPLVSAGTLNGGGRSGLQLWGLVRGQRAVRYTR